jgi:hypothetical protein
LWWTISLRTCQIRHHTIIIITRTCSDAIDMACSIHSEPVFLISSHVGIGQTSFIASQRSLAIGHLQKMWKVSSRSMPQRTQMSEVIILRFSLFSHVARPLVATLQAKTRTLGGAGHPHTMSQTVRRPSGALLAAHIDMR